MPFFYNQSSVYKLFPFSEEVLRKKYKDNEFRVISAKGVRNRTTDWSQLFCNRHNQEDSEEPLTKSGIHKHYM